MVLLTFIAKCDISLLTIIKERAIANLYGLGWYYDIPQIDRHIQMAGTIWFLPGLFFSLLTVRIALKLKYPIIFIFLMVSFAYCSALHIKLPMSFQPGITASIFVYIGYCAKQINIIISREFRSWLLTVIAIVFWGYSALVIGPMGIDMCNFSNMFINIVAAICASYVILRLSFVISSIGILEKFFSYIGSSTLCLFCIHACTQAAVWQFSPEFHKYIDIPISGTCYTGFIIFSPFVILLLKDAIVCVWRKTFQRNQIEKESIGKCS